MHKSKRQALGNWFSNSVSRTSSSASQVFIASLTAAAAYFLSEVLWGHEQPFFSAVTAFLIIGFTLETKVRKSIELSGGILLGIGLGELAKLTIHGGAWQIMVTLLVAVSLARFINSGITFTLQVAVQSMIVLLLPLEAELSPGARAVDALTGIVLALIVHLLFASDPRKAQRRAARRFYARLSHNLGLLSIAAREADEALALTALNQLREDSQNHIDAWQLANEAAGELTSISPTAHRHAAGVRRMQHLLVGSDRAMRNARIVARREVELLRSMPGTSFEKLADALNAAKVAVDAIQEGMDDDVDFTKARRKLKIFTSYLVPETIMECAAPIGRIGHFQGVTLSTELRSLATDLLEATGISNADTRLFLPSLAVISDDDLIGPPPITREMKAIEPEPTTQTLELLITDRTDPERRKFR